MEGGVSTPRTLLVDAQGRLMQRAQGDLATPDCPECCGGLSVVRADLCTTTPGYADVHPKHIYIDCPPDGYFCYDPATKRLVKYVGNGHCYRPNYSTPGPVVCEEMPTPGIDDVYVGPAEGSIYCLPPPITCNSSTCKGVCDGDPDCCETKPSGCTTLPNCPCQDGPTCDCGKKWIVLWSAGSVEEFRDLDQGGLVTRRVTKTAAGFMLYTSTCNSSTCVNCLPCGLPGGGMRTLVEDPFNSSDTWTDYNPPQNCSGAYKGLSECGDAWGHVVCFFSEVGGSDMLTLGCNAVVDEPCTQFQDGSRLTRAGVVRCDGFALEVFSGDKDSAHGCAYSRTKTTTVSGQVARLIECVEGMADTKRPGAMDLL
jgi:hypothetical protein